MQKDTNRARVTVALPARGQPCAAEPNMQTAKLGIQPDRVRLKWIYKSQTKMAINSIREDLPKNQAQEGALKQLRQIRI